MGYKSTYIFRCLTPKYGNEITALRRHLWAVDVDYYTGHKLTRNQHLPVLGNVLFKCTRSQLAHRLSPAGHKVYPASSFTEEADSQLQQGTARPDRLWHNQLSIVSHRNPSETISIEQVHCFNLLSYSSL